MATTKKLTKKTAPKRSVSKKENVISIGDSLPVKAEKPISMVSKQPMTEKKPMTKHKEKSVLSDLWAFIMWIVGLLVSLSVGFGMTSKILTIPSIPAIVTISAGWIVVVLTLLGVLLKIIDKLSGV